MNPLGDILPITTAIWLMLAAIPAWADGNRLAYLDEFCDPYVMNGSTPKLTTPQWIGEEGVDAVVTLGIDDMRANPDVYETFLRPLLGRLRRVDGRAPVSIMTCELDPDHPQLQEWLREGLSLETHTQDHPCPCLYGDDFQKAKETYDRCVDQLCAVPGSRPVAFRFPCMDSLNTPSPRGFAEIFNSTTPAGNFLQISSSVCTVLTSEDEALPRNLTLDADGQERFAKYVPFPGFVNKIENYPYPYVIGRLCWEFPCAVPDDWQGQHLNGKSDARTAADFRAFIDAVVIKQGTANFVFHPSNWLGQPLLLEVVDGTIRQYGSRVRFLTFRECIDRLSQHLLAGQALRADDGQDNGVRLLDINNDGYLDVVIGNDTMQRTRIWRPELQSWYETGFPVGIVNVSADGKRAEAGVRFGILRDRGLASLVIHNERVNGVWHFEGQRWERDEEMSRRLLDLGEALRTAVGGQDQGVRLRDTDGDGTCEILVGNPRLRATYRWNNADHTWQRRPAAFPEPIVDAEGRDAGLRFVDLNRDGHDDIVFSNDQRFAVHVFRPDENGWQRVRDGSHADEGTIPSIVQAGKNRGAWFANQQMWLQNENTDQLPNGVDRRSFAQLLGQE